MHEIGVSAIHDGTFIFTVTARDHTPWGPGNTTIYVPPEQLAGLVAKLQARLKEVEEIRAATPALMRGQRVRVIGRFHEGQEGTVVMIEPKSNRRQQATGDGWSYTVAFRDGSTWTYNADELEVVR